MEDQRIEAFLEGIEQMFSNMQTEEFWPAKAPQMDSYYNDIIAGDLYLTIKELKNRKTTKEIADLVSSASALRALLYNPIIIGMKVLKCYKILPISSDENIKFILFLFDVLKEKTNGDPFCLDGTNLVLSDSEISKIVKGQQFLEAEKIRKELSLFNINLQSFIWSVCFDVMAPYGMEIHGPYNVSKLFKPNSVMIVRDFFDFKQPLWNLNLGFDTIRIMNVYQNINFRFDMSDHFVTDKSPSNCMTHWCVLVNGKPVNLEKVQQISAYITEARRKQRAFVDSLNPLEIVEKSAEINYYTLRKLWEAADKKDWKFSLPRIKNVIKNKGLKYWNKFADRKLQDISFFKAIYDPRTDFPIK